VGKSVSEVAFSPDGASLAVAGTETVLYRLTGCHERRLLAGHAAPVRMVSFHPRRPLLASLAPGDDVLLWDLAGARPVRRWPGPDTRGGNASALAFSPDGALLAVGPYGNRVGEPAGKGVHLWGTDTGKLHRSFALNIIRVQLGPKTTMISYGPRALSFDPAGNRLAVSREHHVDVIDITSGEAKPITIEMSRRITFFDGDRLLVESAYSVARFWDLAAEQLSHGAKLPWEEETRRFCAWEPGGECLAVVRSDGAVCLVGLPGLETRGTLAGRDAKVTAAALGARGRWLATGGQDSDVLLRDTQTLQETLSLPPHDGPVRGLAFGGDAYLAAWGEDGTVTLYHLALIRKQLTELGLDW
jgi:WD40 repeat protein